MKPMLAVQIEDVNALRFPVYVSPKLDGVRALVTGGKLVSRNLKPIPNAYAQQLFAGLPEGTDGELIVGQSNDDPYRRTVSAVMSEDGEPKNLYFHVFDNFNFTGGFKLRFGAISAILSRMVTKKVCLVPHVQVNDVESLDKIEADFLNQGYEGAMVRSFDGPYKFGRSTEREGYLLKLKRFKDAEAEVLDTYEFMHNDNEPVKNALGRTERSSHQENLRPAGILGGFVVKALNGDFEGATFRIGTGLTMEDRTKFWDSRGNLIGAIVKFKYFPTGAKDKPRFPVFLGFRDKRDM